MAQRFEYLGKGPFDWPSTPLAAELSAAMLSEQGLAWHQAAPEADALVGSTPERLLVEILPALAQEPHFALKGGTAINLLEHDLPCGGH